MDNLRTEILEAIAMSDYGCLGSCEAVHSDCRECASKTLDEYDKYIIAQANSVKPECKTDMNLVIHPKHYSHSNRKECWEEMRELFGDAAVAVFDILSAYQYLYRAGTKDGNSEEQDKAKIENYKNHCKQILDRNCVDLVDANAVFRQFTTSEQFRDLYNC